MEEPQNTTPSDQKHPDEDGTILVYGFLVIKDVGTGEILVSTRA